MKVLVSSSGATTLDGVSEALAKEGHEVERATDSRAGLEAVMREPPDIAVVAASPGSQAAMAEALHAPDDPTARWFIAVVPSDEPCGGGACEGRVDDVARASVTPGEILCLVRKAERVLVRERHLTQRSSELEGAIRRMGSAAAGHSLLVTSAWVHLGSILSGVSSDFLGTQCRANVAGGTGGVVPGASTTLLDAEHELALDLAIHAADARSARRVALDLCGGDESLVDEATARDALLELCNSAMGAVKDAFRAEGFVFTATLPRAAVSPVGASPGALAQRWFVLRADGLTLHAWIAVRQGGRKRIVASHLREDMVLAADVRNDAGVLLARAGTRLTETSAMRLASLVPKATVQLVEGD
jgi:hypothetical protein